MKTRDDYQFENEYGEKFLLYRKDKDGVFYITGDEFDWIEHILIVLDLNSYCAFLDSSWCFQFSAEETAKINKFIRKFLK